MKPNVQGQGATEKRDVFTEDTYADVMADKEEKLSAAHALYVVECGPTELALKPIGVANAGQPYSDNRLARSHHSKKNLVYPPWKISGSLLTSTDKVQMEQVAELAALRLDADIEKANEIMVEGLNPSQKRLLRKHRDPFERWKAMKSFFFLEGDEDVINQFQDAFQDKLRSEMVNKDMGRYLDEVDSAATSWRTVAGEGVITDTALVGKVIHALPKATYGDAKLELKVQRKTNMNALTWSMLRSELLKAERERKRGEKNESDEDASGDDSDKDDSVAPSNLTAQITKAVSTAVSTALVTGFQQLRDGGSGGRGGGGGGGRWRGGGGGGGGGGRWRGGGREFAGECFCCGRQGHRAAQCPDRHKRDEK